MIKIVDPSDFNFDQPIMSLVDVHRDGVDKAWLEKSAAVLTKEMSAIRPEKDTTFMHLIALGDLESYGLNRNGDGFPKAANVAHHKSFEKYANFYRHHKNKPAKGHKIYGQVKHAAYNEPMNRVELIIGIDHKAAPDTIQKIASGKDIPVSMACTVPHDECTICGNKAPSTDKYCGHLKKYATQMLDDGRQVGMLNHEPKFFDISEVTRNADRIAFTLRKVASAGPVFSADLAAEQGITAPDELMGVKYASRRVLLRKLASMEAALEQEAKAGPMQKIAQALKGITHTADVDDRHFRGALAILKEAGAVLPIDAFFKMAMGKRFSEVEEHIPAAMAHLPSVFRNVEKRAEEFLSGVDEYSPLDIAVPLRVKTRLNKVANDAAMTSENVNGKLVRNCLTKSASVVPYNSAPSNDPAGRALAEEYARYKLAAVEGADSFVQKMSILQNL